MRRVTLYSSEFVDRELGSRSDNTRQGKTRCAISGRDLERYYGLLEMCRKRLKNIIPISVMETLVIAAGDAVFSPWSIPLLGTLLEQYNDANLNDEDTRKIVEDINDMDPLMQYTLVDTIERYRLRENKDITTIFD